MAERIPRVEAVVISDSFQGALTDLVTEVGGRLVVRPSGGGAPSEPPAAVMVLAGGREGEALAQLPELVDVNTDQQNKGLSTSIVIDRDAVQFRDDVPAQQDRLSVDRDLEQAALEALARGRAARHPRRVHGYPHQWQESRRS